MSLQIHFLGTGTSAGVPMIGCDAAACCSDDPRDQRSRPSVLICYRDDQAPVREFDATFNPQQVGRRQLLIDTAPELRLQAIAARLSRLS